MKRWIVAAAFLVTANAALVACGGTSGGPSFGEGGPCPEKTPPSVQSNADMSVEELTNLVAEAITCPGYAFHMRSAGDFESGPYSRYTETETWIDLESGLGRVDLLFQFTSDEALAQAATAQAEGEDAVLESRFSRIVRSDATYSSAQGDHTAGRERSPSCHASGRETLSLVLDCFDGPLQEFEISVDRNNSYSGQDAIAYVAEGTSSGSDETYYLTRQSFFDAKTFLPLGGIVEGTLDEGVIHQVQSDIPVEHEFVPLDSLPDDFFDPASIGYVEPEPEAVEEPLNDAEIEVYWLGREFAGSDEYPALALDSVFARLRSRTGEGGSVVELRYRPADDEFGYNWVSIGLYTPEAFEFRDDHTVGNPCQEIVELDLAGSYATIRRHREQSPDGTCNPADGFSGVVFFDDVVIDITAVTTNSGRQVFRSPYKTEEAIELLIRSLELRE